MIPLKKAIKIILKETTLRKVQEVLVASAHNRILAEDIRAVCDSPDFDKSMMDGFAVKASDIKKTPVILKIIEEIPAGKRPLRKIKKGQCSKIATGAMLPLGSDSVVIKEETLLLKDNKVRILGSVKPQENVYKRGEFFKKGSLLLRKNSLLDMPKVALVSSQGLRTVKIFASPSVAIMSTGNEVVEPGLGRRVPQIWNATAPMLGFALRSMGIEPGYLGVARDDKETLFKKIKSGLKYDILIIAGAVSVGDFDLVPAALKEAGIVPIFHKVAIRPGKPFLFARSKRGLVFGLPGNPVSSFVGFSLFVKPAINKILGLRSDLTLQEGILTTGVHNTSGRLSLLPARLVSGNSKHKVSPLRYCGSADLKAAAGADVFFIVGKNEKFVARNSKVKFVKLGL